MVDVLSYKEFCVQLIMFEKDCCYATAEKVYYEFMEDDNYAGIFNLGECWDHLASRGIVK